MTSAADEYHKFTPTLLGTRKQLKKGFWNRLFRRKEWVRGEIVDCQYRREGNIVTISGTIKMEEIL